MKQLVNKSNQAKELETQHTKQFFKIKNHMDNVNTNLEWSKKELLEKRERIRNKNNYL